jgi:sec-independent protein translocase protein TatC
MEVRKRLFLVISITVIATAVGFFYYDRIITLIIKLLDLKELNVVFTSPFQYFELSVNAALLIGITVAFPVIIIQLLSFLKPALQKNEYRLLVFTTPVSLMLFVGGFIFGVVMMKYTIHYFQQESAQLHIGSVLDISKFLSSIITVAMLMGLAFQFPLILTLLLQLRVISLQWLTQQRRFVYLGALLFIILLPITNVVIDFILTLPLVILFEITVLLNTVLLKRKRGEIYV